MPVGPIDYMAGLKPLDTSALTRGLALAQQRSEGEQAQQRLTAYRAAVEEAFSENTPQAFARLTANFPEQREAIQQAWGQLDEARQKEQLEATYPVYHALLSGEQDVAMRLVDDQIEARKNSGMDTGNLERIRRGIETNPKNIAGLIGMQLANVTGPDEFLEKFKLLSDIQQKRAMSAGELEQQAAELGLTKAQTGETLARTEKFGVETRKSALELEAMKSGEVPIDPEKKFNMERSLANDYQKRSANIGESERSLDIIESSAADQSGAGDIALVTSFMKMLDPGSVVRETEFATARDTAGLYAMMKNWAESKTTGAFLSPGQRKSFARLARKYMDAALREDARVRQNMGYMVRNYGLSEQNVFGSRAGVAAPEDESTQPKSTQPESIRVDY